MLVMERKINVPLIPSLAPVGFCMDRAEHRAAPSLHGDVPPPCLVSAAPKVPPPAVVALFFI